MGLFLFRFWPVLLPIIYYLWWMRRARVCAIAEGRECPGFGDGPVYKTLVAMLAIALICFLLLPVGERAEKGHYEPPHMENGKVVPGRVEEQP